MNKRRRKKLANKVDDDRFAGLVVTMLDEYRIAKTESRIVAQVVEKVEETFPAFANSASSSPANIEPERWGRDHWSLLAYVATCFDGEVDRKRLRCNSSTHPLLTHNGGWNDSYSTTLVNGTLVAGHDDWDCLDDLEAAGMVSVMSMVNGFVRMTKKGAMVAFRLSEHKASGGVFATFSI